MKPHFSTYQPTVAPVDVVVVGAGINGLAVAREVAYRGLSVALIDADDLGSRTSAISTRLIHGGLKYLEGFRFRLVRECIREQDILLTQAPHLVRQYPMLIPFSRDQSRPGWLITSGMMLHNLMSLGTSRPHHSLLTRRTIERRWPSVADGLRWAGLFQDASIAYSERLCFELALDAQRHGAVVLTHAPVLDLLRDDRGVTGVVYRDRADGELKQVQSLVVVNAAGPWADEIVAMGNDRSRRVGPTKGSHVVVDDFEGAPATCVFFESPLDARPMFVMPWDGRYMIGTTDIPYDESLDEIVIDDDELDYLLSAVNELIPTARLGVESVQWSYSGVRPLPYVENSSNRKAITREHHVVTHEGADAGLVTVVGGKLTTHRSLGEQVADLVDRRLGRPRQASLTRHALLPGAAPGEEWPDARARLISATAMSERVATRLVDVYGVACTQVEALAVEDSTLAEEIDPETGAIAAEIVYAVRAEGAHTLEDVLMRRTLIGLNSEVGLGAAASACRALVSHAGWSEQRADDELASYRIAVRRFRPRVLSDLPRADPAGQEQA